MNGKSLDTHVAVIGAGPYGLSSAASLRAAGIEIRVFGEPMAFWEN
jgi:2-polyprenyl-6-methoxyphenol hydroxylase-like FAD-dependent oxidoreductase